MLISPQQWRARYKPRHKRIIDRVKSANPRVIIIMHSDGAVAPLIDDFIELGVEVYNPVQPNVPGSDPEELARKYGGRMSFFGGIDQQVLLPRGDKAAISEEIHAGRGFSAPTEVTSSRRPTSSRRMSPWRPLST